MKKLPDIIVLNGITYKINHQAKGAYLSGSDISSQEIYVSKDIPFPKQLQFLCYEIAYRLLEATGLKEKTTERIYVQFGNVLYRYIRDNHFEWVREKTYKIPDMIWINGLPYTKTEDHKEYMDAKNLGGEVRFEQLSILLDPDMEPEIKAVVFLHESAHAMLYEAALKLHSREDIVEPLGWGLFQLFTDNDFSFAKY